MAPAELELPTAPVKKQFSRYLNALLVGRYVDTLLHPVNPPYPRHAQTVHMDTHT